MVASCPLMKCARLQSARGTNFSNMGCQELNVLYAPSCPAPRELAALKKAPDVPGLPVSANEEKV
jgi:hypothetical protein